MKRVAVAAVGAVLLLAMAPLRAEATTGQVVIFVAELGRVTEDGGAELRVRMQCPRGYQPLEAFAYVVQGQVNSDFGFVPDARCNGRLIHRIVEVESFDMALQVGPARGTAVLLVENPTTGDFRSTESSRQVFLLPPKPGGLNP